MGRFFSRFERQLCIFLGYFVPDFLTGLFQIFQNDLVLLNEETVTTAAPMQRSSSGKLKMSKSYSISTEINHSPSLTIIVSKHSFVR